MSTLFTPDWLALREDADAAARAPELLAPLRSHLFAGGRHRRLVIQDLGCGTGSQGRWLAGRLPGPQHWILYDHDPGLLARVRPPGMAMDGALVTAETREGDLSGLDLTGVSLVTASAVLDLLTFDEMHDLAEACATARCPALFTLSVVGRVELTPADLFDVEIGSAFDAHQRRRVDRGRLLGPDAVVVATEAFERRGMVVWTRPSPWRLGSGQSALTAEWIRGWVGAAVEQRPDLARPAEAYLRWRLDACTSGGLQVLVHHRDLLALPAGSGR
jgi:hypothetical protein